MIRRLFVSLVLASVLALSGCSANDRPSDGATTGTTQPALTLPARWWLWVESSGDRNPVSDATGEFCQVNQPNDIWFLAGTYGGSAARTCTIPEGRPIYFPVMNLICEVPRGGNVALAIDQCDPQPLAASVDLDGEALEIETANSEGSFRFVAGPQSVIAEPGSEFEAVAGGQWVGPLNLTRGKHVLRFAARSADFALEVTYNLNVS